MDYQEIYKSTETDQLESIRVRFEKEIDSTKFPDERSRAEMRADVDRVLKGGNEQELMDQEMTLKRLFKLKSDTFSDMRPIFANEPMPNKNYVRCLIAEIAAKTAEKETTEMGFFRASLDVEGLKSVNDIMGHEAGDEYLESIVSALRRAAFEFENANAEALGGSRLILSAEGGDEFGIMIIPPKGENIDYSAENFSIGLDSEKKMSLGSALRVYINDEFSSERTLGDFERIAPKGKFAEKLAAQESASQRKLQDKLIELRAGTKKFSQAPAAEAEQWATVYKSKMRVYRQKFSEMTGIEAPDSLEEMLKALSEQIMKKEEDIKKEFGHYEFRPSISYGFVDTSSAWFDDNDLQETLSELMKKFKLGEGQCATMNKDEYQKFIMERAYQAMVMNKSESEMAEDKRIYKNQLGVIGNGEISALRMPDGKTIAQNQKQMRLTSYVLARNDQQVKTMKDLEISRVENKKLSTEVATLEQKLGLLEKRLKDCNEACARNSEGPF